MEAAIMEMHNKEFGGRQISVKKAEPIGSESMKEGASRSDWENLISDNTDDLLIYEPATGSETSNSKGKNYEISLNSQPNASCLHNVSQDSYMNDDGETGEQDGISHMCFTACQEHKNFDLNLKTEDELNNGVPLGCKVSLFSAWPS